MHETPRFNPQHWDYRVGHRSLIEALGVGGSKFHGHPQLSAGLCQSRLQTTPAPGPPTPSQKQANKHTITIHDPVSVWSERLWEESNKHCKDAVMATIGHTGGNKVVLARGMQVP